MPPGYRLGLDNSYGVQHRWKQPIEPHEEQSVDNGEFRLCGNASAQHLQLMPQHDDLGLQPGLGL
jgi:hypothetical protein